MSEEYDHIDVRNRALASTVDNSIEEAQYRTVVQDYTLLPLSTQLAIADRVVRAQQNVVKECIDHRKGIHLPYIGKVQIKQGKAIEVEVMTNVVKELGYEDITSISRVKYLKLLTEQKELISHIAIERRNRRNNSRKAFTNAKVRSFDLNKVRKA